MRIFVVLKFNKITKDPGKEEQVDVEVDPPIFIMTSMNKNALKIHLTRFDELIIIIICFKKCLNNTNTLNPKGSKLFL